jgi:hypothetical protein
MMVSETTTLAGAGANANAGQRIGPYIGFVV